MELYHVTSLQLLHRYIESGCIRAPVRAWKSLDAAVRFGKQTDRRLILRISPGKHFRPLGGHRGQAMVSDVDYPIDAEDLK